MSQSSLAVFIWKPCNPLNLGAIAPGGKERPLGAEATSAGVRAGCLRSSAAAGPDDTARGLSA